MLARVEFRLRDQGTLAGFLWTLLHPLLIFVILNLIFTRWMSPRIPDYAACLLLGIVPWNFLSTATMAGLTSLRRKANLLSSHPLNPAAVLLSSMGAVLLSHLLEWTLLLAALPFMGIEPRAAWLALPLLIAAEAALAVAAAGVLAALSVELRDLEHAWSLLLYGLFFLTPVFYTISVLEGPARTLVALNPAAWIVECARALVLGTAPSLPAPAPALAAAAAAACAASLAFFARRTRGVAERL
jgi:ABC-type polysaccharide/polyol phosphate export permease